MQLLPQRPSRLADHEVLPRLATLVEHDRATTCEMLVLIGRAEARRLYAPTEYPSLFRYCVGKLRMSEDMAWKRIQAARAVRKFPAILAMLADGRLHLTAVVRLAPHLTRDNAGELLQAAAGLPKQALGELLAARFPHPDLAACVQALAAPLPGRVSSPAELAPEPVAFASHYSAGTSETQLVPEPVAPPVPVAPPDLPARITPLAPGRFGVQFTIGQAAHDKLRYAQALASHAVPGGALAEILERALDAYIQKLEKQKFAATSRPRPAAKHSSADPRHVPAAVVREVCLRDEGRCTFVSGQGERCESRDFLELDHVTPVARGGQSTAANVRLRCRTHNQHAAEQAFGAGFMERKREEARRRAEAKLAAARAKETERARKEAYARELEANAAARARALEVMPWLRALGVRADEARRAPARRATTADVGSFAPTAPRPASAARPPPSRGTGDRPARASRRLRRARSRAARRPTARR